MSAWDTIVVGGGPAGAVAASVLARIGHGVLIVDASSSPQYKIGESLPGSAVRLLRLLKLPVPNPSGPHTQIGGNLSSWNSDDLVATDFIFDPDGCGWRLQRDQFDSALRECAVQSGASLKLDQVTGIARPDKHWRLSLRSGQTESARWLIDATGRSAVVARQLGARRLVENRLSGIYALGHTKRQARIDRTVVEAVPQGWWYGARLPSGDLLVGLHVRPQYAACLVRDRRAWLQMLVETHHIARLFPDASFEHRLRIVDASGSRLDRLTGDGWVACGDAALSFDPLSAQGLFAAIYGGMMAGRSVDSALQGGHTELECYAKRLERVWQIYSQRLREIYRREARWPSHVFWSTVA